MCSFSLSPILLVERDRFDAAAASAECSTIMIGPHDEPSISSFGYYDIGVLSQPPVQSFAGQIVENHHRADEIHVGFSGTTPRICSVARGAEISKLLRTAGDSCFVKISGGGDVGAASRTLSGRRPAATSAPSSARGRVLRAECPG
jgi:hypothetical protein